MGSTAGTNITVSFSTGNRREDLIKWGVRRVLPRGAFSKTTFDRRIAALSKLITSLPQAGVPDPVGSIQARLHSLGFTGLYYLIQPLCELHLHFSSTQRSSEERRRHLHDLQQLVLVDDRALYSNIHNQAHRLFPGDENAKNRNVYVKGRWTRDKPPKITNLLPLNHTTAVFIR